MHYKKSNYPLFIVAVLFVVGLLFPAAQQTAHAQEIIQNAPYTRSQVILATNKARATQHVSALTSNLALTRAAQSKANDMAKNDYFSHNTPTGTRFWDFIINAGYAYKNASENLAVKYTTVNAIMKAWLSSPSHRANMLGKQYTDVGVGISYGKRNGQYTWYVVEMMGSKLYKPLYSQI